MGLANSVVNRPQINETKKPEKQTSTLSGVELADEKNPMKIAFLGDADTGKSHKVLELIDYCAIEYQMFPEQIHIEYIDLDGGLAELLKQAEFPPEYLSCLTYQLCQNFSEVVEYTNNAVKRSRQHIQKMEGDIRGTWIVVDNMQQAWDWAQAEYCEAVYGMTMAEKMQKARKSQEEAKKKGPDAHGEGVFNQNLDYPAINAWHNGDWIQPLVFSGINLILLSPWKQEEIYDESGNNVIAYKDRFGQKSNDLRASYIIKLYFDQHKKRLADFTKTRATENKPTKIHPATFSNIFKLLKELESVEDRKRQDAMKKKNYPSRMLARPEEIGQKTSLMESKEEVSSVPVEGDSTASAVNLSQQEKKLRW